MIQLDATLSESEKIVREIRYRESDLWYYCPMDMMQGSSCAI